MVSSVYHLDFLTVKCISTTGNLGKRMVLVALTCFLSRDVPRPRTPKCFDPWKNDVLSGVETPSRLPPLHDKS